MLMWDKCFRGANMDKKSVYEKPVIEVITFDNIDVITESNNSHNILPNEDV